MTSLSNSPLDVRQPSPTRTEGRHATARPVASEDSFHTPRSKNLRMVGLLWLLPSRRMLQIALVATIGWALWNYGGRSLEVLEADREGLPSAARIAALRGEGAISAKAGEWEKRRTWGGCVELEYNFEPGSRDQPGVRALLWVDRTEEKARETFKGLLLNTVLDWGLAGDVPVGLVWLDENLHIGDESRIYRVELERRILGHSIAVRDGERTVYAKIEGKFLSDQEALSLGREMLSGMHSVVVH